MNWPVSCSLLKNCITGCVTVLQLAFEFATMNSTVFLKVKYRNSQKQGIALIAN